MALTDDEFTVLLIADQGAPMIPAGRWKKPCEDLLQKGLLQRTPSMGDPTGDFNLRITATGRVAVENRDAEDTQQLTQAFNAVGKHAETFRTELDRAARLLLTAVRDVGVAQHDIPSALDRYGAELIRYAKELANDPSQR